MITSLAPALVVLDEYKPFVLGFDLNYKVNVILTYDFGDFSVEILKPLTDSLNFVGGDAAWLEFGPDKLV